GFIFFFQAEDGIRYKLVTGVQTCALPISGDGELSHLQFVTIVAGIVVSAAAVCRRDRVDANRQSARKGDFGRGLALAHAGAGGKIGRASCREREWMWVWGDVGF